MVTGARRQLALLLFPLLAAAQPALRPFVVQHQPAGTPAVDLSFLLEAPAGKNGFLRAEGAHLVTPGGRRIRLWGVNLTTVAKDSVHFPPKPDAAAWAELLARYGVNCVRLHFMDVPAPRGILDATRDDTRALDVAQLDRLDFFVAELKKRGIYCDLNLNVGRQYKSGDGVRDFALIGTAKALTYFDPRLIELQKEYARQLLTHYNPYTRSEYRNEPAIAMIEMVNENSICQAWAHGRLAGTKTEGPPETWQDIPPSYAKDLTGRYNAWLRASEPVPRLLINEFPAASKERFESEAQFYIHLETGFYRDMRKYLKETLGAKPLLIATADHGYTNSSYAGLASTSLLDIVDAHAFWQNTPMVNHALDSTVVRLTRSAMAAKPFTVSELNHRFPNDSNAEGIPIVAAYGSFQDWDGILMYTFEPKASLTASGPIGTRADIANDPVKMSVLAAGALLFLRRDVAPARITVERSYSRERVYEGLRLPASERPYYTPGFPLSIPLRHGSRVRSLDGPPSAVPTAAVTDPIVSDTGELAWYTGSGTQGMVAVETARSQALIGFVKAHQKKLRNLSADVENNFCAIVLGSLDSKALSQSSRMLLTAGSRVANSGSPGDARAPTLVEPVTGTITLRNLEKAAAVGVHPLDGAGCRMGKPRAARRTAEGWEFRIGDPATTWYEVRIER